MTENSTAKKHLTLDDRIEIQEGLRMGITFKAIAKRIGKDQTTISKEVKKHIQTHKSINCKDNAPPCPALFNSFSRHIENTHKAYRSGRNASCRTDVSPLSANTRKRKTCPSAAFMDKRGLLDRLEYPFHAVLNRQYKTCR